MSEIGSRGKKIVSEELGGRERNRRSSPADRRRRWAATRPRRRSRGYRINRGVQKSTCCNELWATRRRRTRVLRSSYIQADKNRRQSARKKRVETRPELAEMREDRTSAKSVQIKLRGGGEHRGSNENLQHASRKRNGMDTERPDPGIHPATSPCGERRGRKLHRRGGRGDSVGAVQGPHWTDEKKARRPRG